MSVISYNGITLPMALTTEFQQVSVGDDLSDTDRIYTKFDIAVQTVVNFNYLAALNQKLLKNGEPLTQNPVDIVNNIRNQLLKRRQTLSYKINGVEMIPQPQQGLTGTVDAKNGPVPQYCNIIRMSNVTFLVTYRVIAHYWENNDPTNLLPATNLKGNDVLYNRWTETLDMDINQFTTRTREGKFVIRSDNFDGLTVAQLIPKMAAIGVPEGFLRTSSHYVVSPDGLAIQYRVVDKEQHRMPLYPSFTTTGEYTESLTSNQATFRYGECHVRMTGDKETSQSLMAKTAIAFCLAKLKNREQSLFNDLGPVKAIPQAGSITVDMFQNIVDVRLRAWMSPSGPKNVQGLWALSWDDICESPVADNTNQPFYSTLGTASRLLQAAAYWDPSIPTGELDEGSGQLTNGLEVGQAGLTPEV